MAISISTLRNKMTGGGARPSLFFAHVSFSDELKTALGSAVSDVIDGGNGADVSFFMKGSQIPESTLNAVPINFLGREFKVPSTDRVFQDWTVQVINDEDYRIRHIFEAWIEHVTPGGAIFASQAAFGSDGNQSVFCDMEVHQLTKAGDISSYGGGTGNATNAKYYGSYYFVDAFPTSVSQMDLSWDTKDTIEEFTVTFAYQYWKKTPDAAPSTVSPFVDTKATSWVAAAKG